MVDQDSWPLASSSPKSNNKFDILLVKVFSLKKKTNQIHPATTEKIKSCLFKKTCYLRVQTLLK